MRGKKSYTSRRRTVAKARLLTIVVADIIGSAELHARSSVMEKVALQKDYMRLASGLAKSAGGLLNTFMGDGFMATFPTPNQGVDFAVKFQGQVQTLTARHKLSRDLRTRIGIATGEVLDLGDTNVGAVVTFADHLCKYLGNLGGDFVLDEATVALLDAQKRRHVSKRPSRKFEGFRRYFLYSYATEGKGQR